MLARWPLGSLKPDVALRPARWSCSRSPRCRAGASRRCGDAGRSVMSQERRPLGLREAHGSGRASGLARNATARHSHEWRVLAGFWREKAGAGRVPSFKSGCAAARMLEGVFSRIIRVALGAYVSALMTLAFFNRKLLGNSPHHPGQRPDKVLILNRFISLEPPRRFLIGPAMHSFGSGRQFVANKRGVRVPAKPTLDILSRR